jgi:hypothetical protein
MALIMDTDLFFEYQPSLLFYLMFNLGHNYKDIWIQKGGEKPRLNLGALENKGQYKKIVNF